jgi:hypothetical protein
MNCLQTGQNTLCEVHVEAEETVLVAKVSKTTVSGADVL